MKKFNNIFIHDTSRQDQYVFVIDDRCFYRFNGKYALYEYSLMGEKKEYAQRLGNNIEIKQVYGLFTGSCPECGEHLVNAPVIKKGALFITYCGKCGTPLVIESKHMVPLVDVLDLHVNRKESFSYEPIDVSEEELKEIGGSIVEDIYEPETEEE